MALKDIILSVVYFIVLVSVCQVEAQPDIVWDRFLYEYEYPYNSRFVGGIISMEENNYVLGGWRTLHQDFRAGGHSFLMKLDFNDREIWKLVLGDTINGVGLKSVLVTDSGGFILSIGDSIVGVWADYADSISGYCLNEVSSDGEVLWQRYYSYRSFDDRNPVFKDLVSLNAPEGGYYVWGRFASGMRQPHSNPYLMKINAEGDSLWTNVYNYEVDDSERLKYYYITASDEGTFTMAGNIYYATLLEFGAITDSVRFALSKIDTSGEVLWRIEHPGNGIEKLEGIVETEDESLILVGSRRDEDGFLVDPGICILLKTDANGNIIWRNEYIAQSFNLDGPKPVLYNGILDSDGNYLFAGSIWNDANSSRDVLLVKFSPGGEVLWAGMYNKHFWDMDLKDNAGGLLKLEDGGYALSCESFTSEGWPGIRGGTWLFKTEPDFVSAPDVRLPLPAAEVSVYPNPFSDYLSVQLPPASGAQWNVRLFDLTGRVVYSISNLSSGQHNSGGFIDLQNLNSIPSGAYFLDLRDQNNLIGRIQIWKVK